MPRKSSPDPLETYRRKRSAERTPEPFSGGTPARPRMFVVQKHAARRMHYDLRLEMEGVLQSWAVPKGPSLDPAEKRLAVMVEEHPLEYADFEGLIPEGNYGAGAVIVWDRGRWEPIGDPREGLEAGKLLFDLHGYKMRGRWTLFRTNSKKSKDNEWLLMKKPDGEAGAGRTLPEESIRSGLTVEELREGRDPAETLRSEIERLRAPQGRIALDEVQPMLGRAGGEPFSDPAWVFEIKYDGFRLLAAREGERARVRFRGGHDATRVLPEIADAVRALPFRSFVIDGEVVVLDATGKPSFQGLQQRVHLSRPLDVARGTIERPATMFVFDLLGFEDRDLRPLPLVERKALLRRLLPPLGPLRYCEHIEQRGEDMYEAVCELGLEGLMAKRADSKYVAGRSDSWLKIRADRTGDFVVVGFSPPKRAREGFGALHLAAHRDGVLTYAGRVGTGFDSRQLDELHEALLADRRADPPCVGQLPSHPETHTWVEPGRVVEVRYKEWTESGLLRHPVFLRERPDKRPEECALPGSAAAAAEREPAPEIVAQPAPREIERKVNFTNLDKVFWPAERYTKGDLIEYYRSIGPWLLPYLTDRPVVLTRYPDGIEGKSFYQKDAPGFAPSWVRMQTMWSEHAQREIRYFVCDDVETLTYIANLGTIPLHLWSSRVQSLQNPDWSILDLDPKKAPFRDVIRVALRLHELCEAIELPSFVKTSGSTGLHVLVPLDGRCTYEHSRTLAELLARIAVAELPDIATLIRAPGSRGDRVYIDYLQNGHGKLLVAPFSVRPLPGAPVSMPLSWEDVRPGLDIRRYTIENAPRRMRTLAQDPLRGVLEIRPDLPAVLERLAHKLQK